MNAHALATDARHMLGDFALRATILLVFAQASAFLLKRRSAAVRHLVWACVLCSLIALPFLDSLTASARRTKSLTRFRRHSMLLPQVPSGTSSQPTERDISTPRIDLWGVAFGKHAHQSTSKYSAATNVLSAVYLVVVALLLTRKTCSWIRTFAMIRDSTGDADCPEIRALFLASIRDTGLNRTPKLSFSAEAAALPSTAGWWRPTVLLPEEARQWSHERLHAVFLHELAHIRRGDWIVQQIACIACCLLWFHPLAWMGFRALRMEAERAADDEVLRSGMRATTYTGELMALIQFLQTPKPLNLSIINPMKSSVLMAQASTVSLRIQALLDRAQNRNPIGAKHLAVMASLLLGSVFPLSVLHLQAAEAPSSHVSTPMPFVGNTNQSLKADRSTPEAALATFVAAINASDLAQAAACIRGGDPAKVKENSALEVIKEAQPHIQLGEVLSKVNGNTALVIVADGKVYYRTAGEGRPAEERALKDEHVNLILDGTDWKIAGPNLEQISGDKEPEILSSMAALFVASSETLVRLAQVATTKIIQNQMRQIALAAIIFANGHQNKWQFRAVDAKKALQPYLGEFDVFTPPAGSGVGYVFNQELENKDISSVSVPSETVLLYEAVAGPDQPGAVRQPAFKHNNRANVAFVDGHVAALTADEFAKVRW